MRGYCDRGKIVVMDIIYWSVVHPGGDGGIVILASYKFHFIRVHHNQNSEFVKMTKLGKLFESSL